MEISFQSTSSTINFENWLKAFKDINNSLLMEIDPVGKQFVAKTFTQGDKAIVKFGKISFEEACLEVVSVTGSDRKKITLDEWVEQNQTRIKVGFSDILEKVIKVVNLFNGTDNYKINVKFSAEGDELIGNRIEFKSLSLDMAASCAEMDEFTYIPDEQFIGSIAKIDNPVYFNYNTDAGKFLVNISNIFSVDAKKDIIDFKVKKEGSDFTLHAVDYNMQSYNYNIGFLDQNKSENASDELVDIHIPVIRQNFILGTKSDTENGTVVIPSENGGSRIVVYSGDSFITVISSVRV